MSFAISEPRRQQLMKEFDCGLALLNRLRDDQVPRVRQIIKSWTGIPFSEANVHEPLVRRAIKHVLSNNP